MPSSAKKLILIILLFVVCIFISVKQELTIRIGNFEFRRNLRLSLGLDLAGGSHLVFEADTSRLAEADKKDAIESAKNIIEQRVNLFGVSEASVQTSSFNAKERIIVDLPGVEDTKKAAGLIGQTAQLDFREFLEGTEATESATLINTRPTGFTGADFKKATPTFDSGVGKPVVSFEVKAESADKFEEITTRLIGKRLIIFLDQTVITDAIVQQPIRDAGQITGNFSVEGTRALSKLLNAGALPVPVSLVEERTIGATLGVDSVSKSIRAGLVGLGMVLFFMVLSYGKLGLIADFALLIFAVVTLTFYKLIPVTLTLPGIAGFLLSVGMAVDSNILIFERFKEEKKLRSFTDALEAAFGRAWDSIRDANIATLVTAFILWNPLDWSFLHTSGPVRGFAITLALGIGISLFTGIVVTRNLLRVFIKEDRK
ncbi:protein translocase subunit SecD [Candidatus Woesebacteria bacterium]|nr:protein translocase subunit SecD [Candidatus Woesebacteria bacterium]